MVKMSQVKLFISHSERDERFVEPLARWLQTGLNLSDADVRCTSVIGMENSRVASEVLRHDLRSAQVVVGLLSTNSLHSHWAQMEMGAGWVQDRLHPIRGPGIAHSDLPAPHDTVITPGYCEKNRMRTLMTELANVLDREVNAEADRMLDELTLSAEETLAADAVRWFSLPPVLSAWSIDAEKYNHAFHLLCSELDLTEADLFPCVTAEGDVMADPEQLPKWAQEHWTVSKIAVNFMLTHSSGDPYRIQIPTNVIPAELVADMKSALGAGKKRSVQMQKWFERATDYISKNPPTARPATGHTGHHRHL